MFFRVENLGPLKQAEVDLSKELILLTGPNNTGKTYLAWSVYGLFQMQRRSQGAPAAFGKLAEEILSSPGQSIPLERIAQQWPDLLDSIAEHFARHLHLCFAAERRYFSDVKVSLRPGPGELQLRRRLSSFSHVGELSVRIPIGQTVSIDLFQRPDGAARRRTTLSGLQSISFAELPSTTKDDVMKELGPKLASTLLLRFWPDCVILPTERTAVDLFARELSSHRTELVSRAVEAEIDPEMGEVAITRDVGRYPWPIQDGLELANDLSYYAREETSFAGLASDLEEILGGELEVSEQGVVSFKPGNEAPAIGIHLASSIVKSLEMLVFYFRHLAVQGDLLMIDEPELNLHPDNQRRVARVLAKAVNRGLRVIVSTHSDYILRELNNLLLLARDTESIRKVREDYKYEDAELLSPSKVGVYLFRGGTAEAVPVTEDGFEVQTIEDEINKMNAISQAIFAAIHE